MGSKVCFVYFWLFIMPSSSPDLDWSSNDDSEHWGFRQPKQADVEAVCLKIQPSSKDIIRRFYAILPYFDKDRSNTVFLHKLRGTIYSMSEGDDVLDREVSYYATVMVPVLFLHQYRDIWCLLERFHRAIRLYQASHPTEKRSALKILQHLRAVNLQIHGFIKELQGPVSPTRSTRSLNVDDDAMNSNKDIIYFRELIKNLG